MTAAFRATYTPLLMRQACHQASGEGVPEAFPPLAESNNGHEFNGVMRA